MQPTLVVLAAGIGSRFGGLKQVESVGPGGAILDYSAFDATRAGFGKIVFVIRPDMEADFRAGLGDRIANDIEVAYAFQRLDDLPAGFAVPAGRTKPWGTAQAVLAAMPLVREPFGVINADDFYGTASIKALADFLRDARPTDGHATYAMVGFRIADTLSDHGSVSRGICKTTGGWLESITEITRIERRGEGGVHRDERGEHILSPDTPVSMNCWGFTADFFAHLQAGFREFLQDNAGSTTAEYYLPTCVQDLMKTGRARVRVLPTTDVWCGITHRDDLPRVREFMAGLIERGVYPQTLWA